MRRGWQFAPARHSKTSKLASLCERKACCFEGAIQASWLARSPRESIHSLACLTNFDLNRLFWFEIAELKDLNGGEEVACAAQIKPNTPLLDANVLPATTRLPRKKKKKKNNIEFNRYGERIVASAHSYTSDNDFDDDEISVRAASFLEMGEHDDSVVEEFSFSFSSFDRGRSP